MPKIEDVNPFFINRYNSRFSYPESNIQDPVSSIRHPKSGFYSTGLNKPNPATAGQARLNGLNGLNRQTG